MLPYTFLALHTSRAWSSAPRGTAGDVCQEPHADNIGAGGAGTSRQSRPAVARISRPRSNHQKPGRGIAERLRDPSCRSSSDQASGCLATRLQGGAIRGRVCAFLATRAEHPNTQVWGRRKDVKVFGCSDDCARCGTLKVDRMPTKNRAEMAVTFGRGCGFASGRVLGARPTRDRHAALAFSGQSASKKRPAKWGLSRT